MRPWGQAAFAFAWITGRSHDGLRYYAGGDAFARVFEDGACPLAWQMHDRMPSRKGALNRLERSPTAPTGAVLAGA
jgi:hypothetical protein